MDISTIFYSGLSGEGKQLMKRIGLISGLLLAVVMLAGWSSIPQGSGLMSATAIEHQSVTAFAASGVPVLTLTNQTGETFYVTLTGPSSYWFQVLPGKNNFEVMQGEYTLSYFACGAQQTNTVNVKKSGATLKLTCGATDKSGNAPVLNINNKTGGSFYLTLTGPKTYTFNVPTGKSTYQVDQGTYDVSYYACSEQRTDSVKIKKKGGSLTIDCTKAKTGKEIAITVNNMTGGTMYMTLTGPASYQFTLPVGKTKIYVLKGTYTYTVYGSCGSDTGTANLSKKGSWSWWCY